MLKQALGKNKVKKNAWNDIELEEKKDPADALRPLMIRSNYLLAHIVS